MFMMMGTESFELREKRRLLNEWTTTLPKEYDGLTLGVEGYEDEHHNLILPLTFEDTGKNVETLFAELYEAMDEEGFGD